MHRPARGGPNLSFSRWNGGGARTPQCCRLRILSVAQTPRYLQPSPSRSLPSVRYRRARPATHTNKQSPIVASRCSSIPSPFVANIASAKEPSQRREDGSSGASSVPVIGQAAIYIGMRIRGSLTGGLDVEEDCSSGIGFCRSGSRQFDGCSKCSTSRDEFLRHQRW